jgi:perosamine synthetase
MQIKINNILIYENSTIRDAMKAISIGEIGVALSVKRKNNSFIRIITDGDIRRALLDGYGLKSSIKVIDKKESVVVGLDTQQSEVTAMFGDQIRIIPVVNDKQQVVNLYFYDKRNHLAVANPLFDDKEIELVNECMVSGWISSGGKFVKEFEEAVAKHTDVKYAVSCSSGTSALHLILLAHGIGVGDEVIIPSLTFIATANAVTYSGAKPVFIDSDIETWNIDTNKIESAITNNTKAIIPVHLYGHPANMDSINKIAKKHNLKVIEDAAEAQGSHYKGRKVGSLGDASTFSFFGNKIITTGEGGMVVTDDPIIAEKCRLFRDHGMSTNKRYWHTVLGYNYRLTNIQAAIGVAQMDKIDSIISKKKWIASEYKKHLRGLKGVTLPPNMDWADNVFWLYTILIDCNHDNLIAKLKRNGIDSRPVFPPIHTQPIYQSGLVLPVSEKISRYGISLPSSPSLNGDDILKICNVIKNVVEPSKI